MLVSIVCGIPFQICNEQCSRLLGLHLLRPAEAAARRLIVVLARGIAVALPPSRTAQSRPNRVPRQKPDWMPFALPRFPDQSEEPRPFPSIFPAHGDPEISGARLALRLDALCFALDDLQAQAQRLARWQARRRRGRASGAFCTTQPLRLGLPLDLRGRAGLRLKNHELFDILKGAHERAWWAQNKPNDTS